MRRSPQVIRVIALGSGHEPISDAYIDATATEDLAPNTRRVVLVGEGALAPVAAGVAVEAVGADPGSTLLAIGPRAFAAHGCVLHARNRLRLTPRALDGLPAAHVLRQATSMRWLLPAAPDRSSLVLRVAPTGPDAGSAADGVRWATADAMLSDLGAVVGPDGTALIMAVQARQPWRLDLDLGPGWRLTALALVPLDVASMTKRLGDDASAELVDDHMRSACPPGPRPSSSWR